MGTYCVVFIVMMLDGLIETIACLYEGQHFYSFQNDLLPEKLLKEIALANSITQNDTGPLDFPLLEFTSSDAQKNLQQPFTASYLLTSNFENGNYSGMESMNNFNW